MFVQLACLTGFFNSKINGLKHVKELKTDDKTIKLLAENVPVKFGFIIADYKQKSTTLTEQISQFHNDFVFATSSFMGYGLYENCILNREQFDYGEQLPGAPMSDKKLEIDGLTSGDIRKSALLITHYHGDHIGKITELPAELPIYMGKMAKEIVSELANHLSVVSEGYRKMAERLTTVNTFTPRRRFNFGEFEITPIVIDHSAFDAYAFCIGAKELKVFHTGDFRKHSFRSGKLSTVIERYVERADYIVCEATNVNRPEATLMPERELQKEFEKAFSENKYNVVYVSSTNIVRLFGLYHAAIRANRPFFVDAYQKKIMDIVAGRDILWGKSSLYNYVEGHKPQTLIQRGSEFVANNKFIDFVTDHGYVLVARQRDGFFQNLTLRPLSLFTLTIQEPLPIYSATNGPLFFSMTESLSLQ